MRQVQWHSVAVVAFLVATASPVAAAEKTIWVGRDIDNNKVHWTCTNISGNDWTLKKNGKSLGDYEGVTSTADFVELQAKGTKTYDRVRLYKDNLSLNKEGSKTKWIKMANGKWTE